MLMKMKTSPAPLRISPLQGFASAGLLGHVASPGHRALPCVKRSYPFRAIQDLYITTSSTTSPEGALYVNDGHCPSNLNPPIPTSPERA